MNNMHIVNAPAGSGKTTKIESMINSNLKIKSNNKIILCVTYTNRAAEELMSRIRDDSVYISTIHSFLMWYFSKYFILPNIIDLYCRVFKDRIKDKIEEYKEERDEKYKLKFNENNISLEIIKRNLKEIWYGESQFSSYYYGMLSHDDLIVFCSAIIKKFPKLTKNFKIKFDYVFIDEYQDSSNLILDMFYSLTKQSNIELYLFGDLMQQIYENYDGSFEIYLGDFKKDIYLNYNYRSTINIVKLLNNIYNEEQYVQIPSSSIDGNIPRAIINDEINYDSFEGFLRLVLLNRERFESIKAGNLYDVFTKLEDYRFGSKYSVADILTKSYTDNPDKLLRLLFSIYNAKKLYLENDIGRMLIILNNTFSMSFNNKYLTHSNGKRNLSEILEEMFAYLDNFSEVIIQDFTDFLFKNGFIGYLDYEFFCNHYVSVLEISMSEIVNICKYIEDPTISTQHGVKGEGHEKVLFILGKSRGTPNIDMYKFLDFWADNDINMSELQAFYYTYNLFVLSIVDGIGVSISKMHKDIFDRNRLFIDECMIKYKTFLEYSVFKNLYFNYYTNYETKPNLKNFKEAIKITKLKNILFSYKLFYVGCSRAKKELVIYVDKRSIRDVDKITKKLIQIGFEVQ